MKKIIMIIMALCIMAPMAQAELTKSELKTIRKEAKARAKEFKKQGYSVMGSVPLESAIEKHRILVKEGAEEQPGYGTAKSKNNGRQMCLTYALNEYSTRMMSQIKGRSVTDSFANENDEAGESEIARFYAAFERITQMEIQGELQESYSVCKELPDGRYRFEMYFTIDPERASQARQRAVKNAAIEAGLTDAYAKKISDFVAKGIIK